MDTAQERAVFAVGRSDGTAAGAAPAADAAIPVASSMFTFAESTLSSPGASAAQGLGNARA